MRILLINYELPPIGAGAGNATHHIARQLARTGDDVLVLTARFAGLPRRETRDGYAIRRSPALRRRPDRSTPLEMASFLLGGLVPSVSVARSFRPEAACAFFALPSGPLALLLERVFAIPYLVSLRGGDVPGFLPEDLARVHRLTLPFLRAVGRRAFALVANSEGLATLAHRTWPDRPIRVIPNGVDLDEFAPAAGAREPGPLRLLAVGRLVRQKGLGHVIAALAAAPADRFLTIVGDGPDRPELEAEARRLGVADRVRFTGWAARAALPDHYRQADVFVLPSFEEGMANAVLEALAAGLPIVASAVYGNRDLVGADNGILVAPADASAIAAAIAALAADPTARARMAEASRARALALGWEPVATAYRELLGEAVAAARNGRER
jgi:glycosyltransferase involved in cell wall biosynthesis